MSGNRKIFKISINAAIFIILEVAALSMLRHNAVLQDTWIAKGAHAFQAKVWGGSEQVKYYFSLKKVNEDLAEENFALTEEIRKYKEMLKGSEYADSVYSNDCRGFSYTPAMIAKISNNSQHNYIILDKGSDDGIRPQAGIITPQGVIGIVDAVSKHYSYAISFRNTAITVSARIGKKGPVGTMKWDGRSTRGALLNEIPLHIDMERGDTVYTSGYSSIFPADIPLGTVGDSKLVNGATYEINVSLFEDFKTLKYVTVVQNDGKDEIESLISRTPER